MSPNKRTLLWDWTLTRDHATTPALQSSAQALAPSGPITSITNWNAWRPPELPQHLPFRPMVRTPAQLEGGEWDMIRGSVAAELSGTSAQQQQQQDVILHFFNEPERIPVSPSEATALYRSRVLPLRVGNAPRLKLVSPACASDPGGSAWLEEFMGALAPDERPDYLGLHFYTSAARPVEAEIEAAKAYLSSMHSRYALPVIVSEVASTSRDAGDVARFSRALADWMDGQDWVREYGFFGVMREVADGFVSPAAQMLDSEGHWTGLGRWWIGLGDL